MEILTIFIVFFLFALVMIGLLLGLPSTKGYMGERLVRIALRIYAPRGSVIFNNLYFHDGQKSCQIDHLVVAPNGIFVIESKTFLGIVSGKANASKIRRTVLGKSYMIRNPVDQNEYHLKYLQDHIGSIAKRSDALRSIIVYTFMTKLQLTNNPGYIGTLRQLPVMLLRYGTAHLSEEECRRIAADIEKSNKR